jgi:predicted metal-binding membrane protein
MIEGVPPRFQHAPVIAATVAFTVLAWIGLFYISRQMLAGREPLMAAMDMATNAPWTRGDLVLTFVMWTSMMVGMMTPSVTPVLLLAANAPRSDRRVLPPVAWFGAGYLLVWTGFSAIATLAQWALHDAALLSPAMAASNPRVAGAILVLAGLYQLTPLKHACLAHCRSPIDFLMSHWRTGAAGPLRMGVDHGVYCVGCCWALMAVLFAVGVMNLAWVAGLALLVLIEKTTPSAVLVPRVAGAALVVLGAIKLVSNV